MKNLADLVLMVENALQKVTYPKLPEGLYEPVAYVLGGGGKRIRPTLVLLGHYLYSDDVERALPAALALETYHNHTLLHDDLMDRADLRHGRPTVHKKWDDNTAVLSGDTMLILAVRHMLEVDSPHRAELLQLFTRTMQQICEGQQYDVNFERRNDVTEEEYLEMIRLKTSVLLAYAIKCGAIIGGASAADADRLYAFAEQVGLAFQLRDDYLDVYGDPRIFGKKIGGDILCGKKTFLLINALRRADEATRERLLSLLQDGGMPAGEKIAAVTAIYDALHIADLCNEAIEHCYQKAYACLDGLTAAEERTALLREWAATLMGRES